MTIVADSVSPETETQPLVDDALLESLAKDPDKLDDLSDDQRAEVHRILLDQSENPEPPEETPVEEPVKKEEPQTETKETETEPSETPEQKDDKPAEQEKEQTEDPVKKEKSEAQKAADELNKVRQKRISREKAIEAEKKKYSELKQKDYEVKEDDIYDQKNLTELMTKVKRLEDENALMKESVLGRDQKDIDAALVQEQDLQQKRIFAEVDDLQDSFGDLKTKTPFKTMNIEWGGHLDTMVKLSGLKAENIGLTEEQQKDPNLVAQTLRDKAHALYRTDPQLKESVDKFTPESFKDEAESKKYFRILDMNDRKAEHGGTLKMNFYDYLDENGLLEEYFAKEKRDTAIKASNLAADAMENNSPTPLTPSDGPADSPSNTQAMSIERAEQRMNVLRQKLDGGAQWSDQEAAEMKEVILFLEGMKKEK